MPEFNSHFILDFFELLNLIRCSINSAYETGLTELLIENRYSTDVLLSCSNQKLANFAAEKAFGPDRCPVYLKLPQIGNSSLKIENHINKVITFNIWSFVRY